MTRTERAALAVFDALNNRRLDRLDDLVTADFVDHGSPFPLPPGPAGYRTILTFVTEILQLRYEVQDIFSTGDRVAIRGLGHGIGHPLVHGPEAAGRPYQMATIHIYRGEGERLAEHWGVRDELSVLIQLGVVPAPDPSVLAAAS